MSYTYDIGGNIVSKTETTFSGDSKTTTYKYEDSNWKDKLTSFNGKVITYDGIGNPLTYDGWKFQWEQGRKLSKLDGNGYNIRYRGYRYDTETGLYYLNLRYYNAEWGRFVNADGIIGKAEALLSYNMFAYCNNNYPNMVDYNGKFAICAGVIGGSFIVPVLFGAALILTGVYIYITR